MKVKTIGTNRVNIYLGSTLLAKLKRCPELIANTLSQLEQLFSKLNVEYSPEVIQKWIMEEKKFIEEKKCKGSVVIFYSNYMANCSKHY